MLRNSHSIAFRLWLLAICVVVVGSLAPHGSTLMKTVDRLPVNDKVLHFAAYVLLAGLAALGFSQPRDALLAAGSMAFLGVLLEFAQYLAPVRTPEVADEIANVLGVICGIALAFPLRKSRPWATRV